MHRFSSALSVVALVLFGLVAPMSRGVSAQEATPSAMATHPIIGAWSFVDPLVPDNRNYGVFHADGTYTGISPYGGPGIGVWRPTGERSLELTIILFDLDPDPSVFAMGTAINTNAFTVSEDGMSFSGPYSVQGIAPDGTEVFAFRDPAAQWEGTRLEVQPMLPIGISDAGTPTP
jgi:hypothetical protein